MRTTAIRPWLFILAAPLASGACNAIWGVEELHYHGGDALEAGAGGPQDASSEDTSAGGGDCDAAESGPDGAGGMDANNGGSGGAGGAGGAGGVDAGVGGSAGVDAGMGGAGGVDAGVGGSAGVDASTGGTGGSAGSGGTGGQAGDGGVTSYNEITVAGDWSTFNVTSVNSGADYFGGGVFDSRYIYLAPYQTGPVVRYDTQALYGEAASYAFLDLATLNTNAASGFASALFDSRFVYLVQRDLPAGASGLIVRYDTTQLFGASGAWTFFDMTGLHANAKGYMGGAFDSRYFYLAPYTLGAAGYNGVVARYDTTTSLDQSASWKFFDLTSVNASAKGFYGATFDGKYVYLSPYGAGGGSFGGLVARYDTALPFDQSTSWAFYDISTAHAGAKGFATARFDGRYVYLAPNHDDNAYSGLVARYDTTAPFGVAASWKFFDMTSVNANAKGYLGLVFDGRNVFFVPWEHGTQFGLVARYDTANDFSSAGSWSFFDLESAMNAGGFNGGLFDGQYVYMIPSYNNDAPSGLLTRFADKSPPSLPAGWNTSFP